MRIFDTTNAAVKAFFKISSFSLFVLLFAVGVHRGMDQLLGLESYARVATAYASLFTKDFIGASGDAVSDTIFSDLYTEGFTTDHEVLDKMGVEPPSNMQSAIFLDKIIEKMAKQKDYYSNIRHNIRGFGADCVGIIPYTQIATWLFGYTIRGQYYLYYLIFGASLLVFFWERKNDLFSQNLILLYLLLFYSFVYNSPNFLPDPPGSGNPANQRALSLLAILPFFHIISVYCEKCWPINWKTGVAVFCQSLIISFAMELRVTAKWVVYGSYLILGILVAFNVLKSKGNKLSSLAKCAKLSWPLLALIAVTTVNSKIEDLKLNPVYKKEGWLNNHSLWHSVYYSMAFHPDWQKKYAESHMNWTGDNMPFAGIKLYLDKYPEEKEAKYFFAGTTRVNNRGMEEYCKRAFWMFFKNDPVFVIQVWSFYNPRLFLNYFFNQYIDQLKRASLGQWLFFVLVLSATLYSHKTSFISIWKYLSVLMAAAVPCFLVPALTVAGPNVNLDQAILLQFLILLAGISCILQTFKHVNKKII
jgi:hypothetical protein